MMSSVLTEKVGLNLIWVQLHHSLQQKAERIEQIQLGCRFDRDKIVKSDVTLGKSLTIELDLIETFIMCDHSDNSPPTTNGESNFRFPVQVAPFALARQSHWTSELGSITYKTNSMFVNGLYAHHQTRWALGDNLFAQLVAMFPSCQFAAFELITDLKRPIHGLDSKHKAGIMASNCTQVELSAKANATLEFAIDETNLRDLRKLNMSHCYQAKRTLDEFLPAIQPVDNWPDSDFTRKTLIYNQLDLPRLINQSYCHQI